MPRKKVLTKEDIIQASVTICADEGYQKISVRKIAAALNTSTGPIYTQYRNMETILEDMKEHIKERLMESTTIERTHDPFLNIGVGILAFVLENRRIFRDLFLADNQLSFISRDANEQFIRQMQKSPFLSMLGEERLNVLLEDMWIYTYGLATLICTEYEDTKPLSFYQDKLEQTGHKLITYHLYSSGKMEEYMQLFMRKVSEHMDLKEVLK